NSPAVSVSASSLSVCPGATVALTASGANTYTYTGGVVNAVPFTLTTTTTYSVTGTDLISGCSGLAAITITVIPGPTLSVSPSNPSVCLGNAVVLNASGADNY